MAQHCPAAAAEPHATVPSPKQAALGAVLGAYVGDAAGVTLEFTAIKSDEQVRGTLLGAHTAQHPLQPPRPAAAKLAVTLLRCLRCRSATR